MIKTRSIKLSYLFAAIIVLLNLAFVFPAQSNQFSEAKAVPADGDTFYDFEEWTFSIGDDKYVVNRNGKGKQIGKNLRDFQISLADEAYLERVLYFTKYQKDILLLGEVTDFDAGSGFLVRFDGKTLLPKWQLEISAFNIARGLIEGNSAYLAGIGYAAKINLDTGKEFWKHDNFYRKYRESGAFNIFEIPQIEGDNIVYVEKNVNKKAPNVIIFDKVTGEVLGVEVN